MSNEVFLSMIPRGPQNNTFLCSTPSGPQWAPTGGGGSVVINGDSNISVAQPLPGSFNVSLNPQISFSDAGGNTMTLETTGLRLTNVAPDTPIVEFNPTGVYTPSVNVISGTSSTIYSLPTSAGVAGQVLTMGAGTSTEWVDVSSGGTSVAAGTNILVSEETGVYTVALAPQIGFSGVGASTSINSSGISVTLASTGGTNEITANGVFANNIGVTSSSNTTLYELPTNAPTPGQVIKSLTGGATAWQNETGGSTTITAGANILVSTETGGYTVALQPLIAPTQVTCADLSGSTVVTSTGIVIDDSDFEVISELTIDGLIAPAIKVSNGTTGSIQYQLPTTAGTTGQVIAMGNGINTTWASISAQGTISGTTDQIAVSSSGGNTTIALEDDIVLPEGSSITVDTVNCNNATNTVLVDATGFTLTQDSNNAILGEINTTGLYTIGIHQLDPVTNGTLYRLPTTAGSAGSIITPGGDGTSSWQPAPSSGGSVVAGSNLYATTLGNQTTINLNPSVVLEANYAQSSLTETGLIISNGGTPISTFSLAGLIVQYAQIGSYSLPTTGGSAGSVITLQADGTSTWAASGQPSSTTLVLTSAPPTTATITVRSAATAGDTAIIDPAKLVLANNTSGVITTVGVEGGIATLGHQLDFFTGFRGSNLIIDDTIINLTDYKVQAQVQTMAGTPLNIYTPTSNNDGLANGQPFIAEIRVSRESVAIDLNPGDSYCTIVGLDDTGTLTDSTTYMRAVTTQTVPMSLWPRNYTNRNTVLFSCVCAHDMLLSNSPAQVALYDFSQSTDYVGTNPSVTFQFYRVQPIDLTFEILVYINVPKQIVGRPGMLQLFNNIPTPVNYFAGTYNNMLVSAAAGTEAVAYEGNSTIGYIYNGIFNAGTKYIRFAPPQLGLYNSLDNDFMFALPTFSTPLL
jgi:hypothetical protein